MGIKHIHNNLNIQYSEAVIFLSKPNGMDVAVDSSLTPILLLRGTGASKIKQPSEIYHNTNSGSTTILTVDSIMMNFFSLYFIKSFNRCFSGAYYMAGTV